MVHGGLGFAFFKPAFLEEVEAGESVARLVLLDPPVAPPAAKEMRAEIKEEKRIETAKSRISSALSGIFSLFSRRHGSRGRKPTRAIKRGVKMQSVIERIKKAVERMESKSLEQAAYTVEARARVVELLKVAFDKHVPRPYPGKAAMLPQ